MPVKIVKQELPCVIELTLAGTGQPYVGSSTLRKPIGFDA